MTLRDWLPFSGRVHAVDVRGALLGSLCATGPDAQKKNALRFNNNKKPSITNATPGPVLFYQLIDWLIQCAINRLLTF